MREQFVSTQQAGPVLDVPGLAQRLDRKDILLLKEFYHTGRPYPNDTISHVLRLLVDRLRRGSGPLAPHARSGESSSFTQPTSSS